LSEAVEKRGPPAPWLERLCIVLAAACALVALGRAAASRGWIPSPSLPWHLGDIAVWGLGAFCILWGLERGTPEGSTPRPFLRLYRLGVFVAAIAMLGVWIYA
jgi:hypothetical protein